MAVADIKPKTRATDREKRIYGASICFDCQNACGRCEWPAIDQKTGKPGFKPVPGWTAEPSIIRTSGRKPAESFRVTACPKFKQLRKRPLPRRPGAPKRPVVATDKHGKWNDTYKSGHVPVPRNVCSECDCWSERCSSWRPNCGCRMDGEK